MRGLTKPALSVTLHAVRDERPRACVIHREGRRTMTFTGAISDAFSKYATFNGRSSRSAYWWFYLFAIIVVIAALVVDAAIGTGGIIYALVVLGLLLPNLAVTVRRLHDSGHRGWWL